METREVWIGPANLEVGDNAVPSAHRGTPGLSAQPEERPRLELQRSLAWELYQTEASARRHAHREFRRLRDTPPGRALEVISRHAAATLRMLPEVVGARGFIGDGAGRLLGSSFSLLRRVVDPLLGRERSYRMTLLGVHHGIDTVRTIRNRAIDAGDEHLAAWCDAWLDTRLRLLQNAELALLWFGPPVATGQNP